MPPLSREDARLAQLAAQERALGELLAREVFACGGSESQRIQFMAGEFPDNETPLGGLCEVALANVLATALRKFNGWRDMPVVFMPKGDSK